MESRKGNNGMNARLNDVNRSFNGRTIQYNPPNAYWLTRLADYAYENSRQIKSKVIDEWGFERFNFIKRAETQCFIASTAKFVIVTFRGTETDKFIDIITDLDAGLTKGYNGKVHKGFKQAYSRVKGPIARKLADHEASKKTIWLAGHSLGGAVAALAAYDLKEKGFKVNGVYTIGQPRVGDARFAKAFDTLLKNRCFRFAHQDDRIPQIPPREFGYRHAGRTIYIVSGSRLALRFVRCKNMINEIKSMSNACTVHASGKYAAAVQKNINKNPFASKTGVVKEKPLVNVNKASKSARKKINKAKMSFRGLFRPV
jgi:triacylglycerol lipase